MTASPRERALARLRASLAEGRFLLAAGAGSGLAAAAAEAGGADLLVVYNSGRFRSAGHGSLMGLLPVGDANEIVRDLAREVLSVVREVPIVAGICAQHPFDDLDALVHELQGMGIAGVQNFPTTALYGEDFRTDLEATGISFEREVELMRAARRAGLLTCAFVCTPEDSLRMALAGVDVLAPHLGVTLASDEPDALDAAATEIDRIAAPAHGVRDDLIVLFHGGPAVTASDVRRVLAGATRLDGFFAASAVERLPVEEAVEEAAASFASLRRPASRSDGVSLPDFTTSPPTLPFELTEATLADYLEARGLVQPGDEVEVEEFGGGLSNVVLGWSSGGRSGVVKQSRPRLRVSEEWLSDIRRILNERDAIALLGPRLPRGRVPELTFSDDKAFAFGMQRVPADARLWKPELLEGRIDPERARQAGALLHGIHDATWDDVAVERRFVARPLIDQNRLDPWYRAAARSHTDLADVVEYAIERLLDVRRVLVHGDFVPKNIFLAGDGLLLLDYEVVHFGNPGYDVATFVNHMLLKGFRGAEHRHAFAGLAEVFWHTYATALEPRKRELVEQEALLQLGVLMLARVDGKSKVEYLDGAGADLARSFGRWMLRNRPGSIDGVLTRYLAEEPSTGADRR